jgi:hypothetical protein
MTFNNNASQAERKQVLKDTMFNRASSEASEISGRWAKPTQVTGKDQAMHYPRLPTSSPWSNPIEAAEPPLGVDVNETPIVGESFEVEQSLNQDFGWRKTIRDGVPQAAGSLISASPEPTPDGEVVRGGQAEEPALREPLPPSGRHSITQRRVSPNNIKRRLV